MRSVNGGGGRRRAQRVGLFGIAGVALIAMLAFGCGGGGSSSSPQTSASAPAVASLAPASGPAAGGTSVTITGTNFLSGATVTFGSTAATSVSFTNSTTLVAVAPAGTAGAVTVTVTNPGGQSGSLSGGFTYSPNPPTVASMVPTSGPPAGGTPVTITGTNFISGATVMFGSTAATTVEFVNSTTLVAITPAETAGSVTVEVKNPSGQSGNDTNGYAFAVPPGVSPTAPTLPQAGYNSQADVGEPSATAMASYAQVALTDTGNAAQNADALQAAINAVPSGTCDTVITLPAGATFEAGANLGGEIQLPPKSCPAGAWIVIRSAAADASLPAAGVRITPAALAELPVIKVGIEAVTNSASAIYVQPQANNYLLEFLDVTVDAAALTGPNNDPSGALINIGDGAYNSPGNGATELTAADQPTNIVVDHDLLEGSDSPPVNFRRGVGMQCSRCAVLNSWIDQIHETGNDSQAIAGWNSTGPWLVDNNYLSAAGENVIVGGAASNMTQNPTDLTFTHNYIYKPLSWDAGDPSFAPLTGFPANAEWDIKNLLELKSGAQVLIEGNVFKNSWPSNQSGRAIAINPISGNGGDTLNPWDTVSDVTIAYNEVDSSWGVISVTGLIYSLVGAQTARIAVHDNLAINQGLPAADSILSPGAQFAYLILGAANSGASGGLSACTATVTTFCIPSGTQPVAGLATDVYFNHNTVLLPASNAQQPSASFEFDGAVDAGETPFPNWAIDNNIFELGVNGVHGTCSVAGVSASCFTSGAWWNNLVYDTSTGGSVNWCSPSDSAIFATNAVACPIANLAAVGLSDASGNYSLVSDFSLASTSPGYQKGTDGADVGANITLLIQAIAGVAP